VLVPLLIFLRDFRGDVGINEPGEYLGVDHISVAKVKLRKAAREA
jgi:hypothetical protein